jgi:hypothetical protein
VGLPLPREKKFGALRKCYSKKDLGFLLPKWIVLPERTSWLRGMGLAKGERFDFADTG